MQSQKSTGSNARTRALVYTLTATSAVVMGAGILIAQILPDDDSGGAVVLMFFMSLAFAGLAGWLLNTLEDE